MSNPTGKNQFTGGAGKAKKPPTLGQMAKAVTKPKKPKNQVTVLHGTWTGPMDNRVFVPSGKTSKARGPSKYG